MNSPDARNIFQWCRHDWDEYKDRSRDPFRPVFVCKDGMHRSVAMAVLMQRWFQQRNAHCILQHVSKGKWGHLCKGCEECAFDARKGRQMDRYAASFLV